MSKPGRAQEYVAPTAESNPLQSVPPIPEPTGSASHDGAATAPPAASAGDSPAERAPESPVPSTQALVDALRASLLASDRRLR